MFSNPINHREHLLEDKIQYNSRITQTWWVSNYNNTSDISAFWNAFYAILTMITSLWDWWQLLRQFCAESSHRVWYFQRTPFCRRGRYKERLCQICKTANKFNNEKRIKWKNMRNKIDLMENVEHINKINENSYYFINISLLFAVLCFTINSNRLQNFLLRETEYKRYWKMKIFFTITLK